MYIVDSNVFLHVLLHTQEGEASRSFLDENNGNISTTIFNLMEIVSVLSRKYRWKKQQIHKIATLLKDSISVYVPDEYDSLASYELSLKHFITPIDALLLSIARKKGDVLVTYDREIIACNHEGVKVIVPE